MGRSRCCKCNTEAMKRGPWSEDEDSRLKSWVEKNGCANWKTVAEKAGLNRCRKSCRLRWHNYLRPGIKTGNFTPEEVQTIIKLQKKLGNQWSKIASRFPGRTDNDIKNVWKSNLKKNLINMECSASPSYSSSTITGTSDQNTEIWNLDELLAPEDFKNAIDSLYDQMNEIMQDFPPPENQDLAPWENQDLTPWEFDLSNFGVMDQDICPSAEEKIVISVGSDNDYWELMDSLQEQNGEIQGQEQNQEIQCQNPSNGAEKLDDEVESEEWSRLIENVELVLPSETDSLPNKENQEDDLAWYNAMPGSPGNPLSL